jgi:hypothetical protein
MRFLREKGESRREFFRAAARYGLLAGLTAAGLVLGRRALTGQSCINRSICSGCAVFAACGLPAALSARQAPAGKRGVSL